MPNVTKARAVDDALSVMELFEEAVIRGSAPNDLAAIEFAWLLSQPREFLSRVPPERTGVGPLEELHPDTALAWCISHFGDALYREMRDAADYQPSRLADAYRRPFDDFSFVLGSYLIKLLRDGRAGRYRVHGWLGDKGVDLDPGWFVEGNLTFDALANAIVMADGRLFTGIEARFAINPAGDAGDDVDRDDGVMAAPQPSPVRLHIRRLEAEAFLKPGSPLLEKVQTIKDCEPLFPDLTRDEIDKAFVTEVPADRRRHRGQPKK